MNEKELIGTLNGYKEALYEGMLYGSITINSKLCQDLLYAIDDLQKKYKQLQNNWNELKKFISAEWYCFDNESVEFEIAKDILNKMQELEQGKDD